MRRISWTTTIFTRSISAVHGYPAHYPESYPLSLVLLSVHQRISRALRSWFRSIPHPYPNRENYEKCYRMNRAEAYLRGYKQHSTAAVSGSVQHDLKSISDSPVPSTGSPVPVRTSGVIGCCSHRSTPHQPDHDVDNI